MLVGKNFGRCHDTGLGPAVNGHQHRNKGHNRFTASYVTLQESVHLFARFKIFVNLAQHFLLGIGKGKRQMILVKSFQQF